MTAIVPVRQTAKTVEALVRSFPEHQAGDCFPLRHLFAPGVYAREITMPAQTVVVGKIHKTRHLNIISKGRVSFKVNDGDVLEVTAPYTFISDAGGQKVLFVHEETVWTTIHPTTETDVSVLEAQLIEPSAEPERLEESV